MLVFLNHFVMLWSVPVIPISMITLCISFCFCFYFFSGRAISFVTKNFFSKANGNRRGVPNVAVVVLDGWPTDKVEETSKLARESGINIFFITIEAAVESEKQYVVEPNFANKVCNCPETHPT